MGADELKQCLRRRPFQPFRIRFADGQSVDVTRRFQMAVMPKRFVVLVNDHLRFFQNETAQRVEDLQTV